MWFHGLVSYYHFRMLTCCRTGEIPSLQCDDVDYATGTFRLSDTRNDGSPQHQPSILNSQRCENVQSMALSIASFKATSVVDSGMCQATPSFTSYGDIQIYGQ